jgi:hypothetical protein
VARRNSLFHLDVVRSEAPVEADREAAAGLAHRAANLAAFVFGQRHRLFDEDVFARAQRGERLGGMVFVSRHDRDQRDARVA